MLNFHCMDKTFKSFIVSLLAVSLIVTTVICCCIAPSVMARFHKAAMCSQCPGNNSHSHSSNPAGKCRQQLTSAEFIHGRSISTSNVSALHFPVLVILHNHRPLTPPLSLAYPAGGPPPGTRFTPLYLRTFNLRV